MAYALTCTAADDTWTTWNTTTTSATNDAWSAWNYDATSTTATSSATVWVRWVEGQVRVRPSAAELAEQREREARAREMQEKALAEQREAIVRAQKLLEENLDAEQLEAYRKRKVIPIRSRSGKQYEIIHGDAGNVFRLDDQGKRIEQYCIHPVDRVPKEDAMLAQILWLRWCEEEFLKVANKTALAA